ncbi:patatin-like phospholipase family protein [Stieleria varia]|uniref:Patatin-like phospholipase n=1 Tax=Stieleria varia TaxID=2528005 RepID=A0A5C6B7V1_9BACT|nr:patatin-like phospholipase family protein [Stieleria varia]TWU08153.1 Patatin-like phospholipase [Stieleria varia]
MSIESDSNREQISEPFSEPFSERASTLQDGIALCLSGGGYRAMLFHVGALLRLNELGILKQIDLISSVSGGSITAGVLGMNWSKLAFDCHGRATGMERLLVEPIMRLASTTIDRRAILLGLSFRASVSVRIARCYRSLFGQSTLQDLPDESIAPRFVINATSVQTGSLVRMSRSYLADYRVGLIHHPDVLLSQAVGASSAFPPFLSPATIELNPEDFDPGTAGDLFCPPFNQRMVLTDGGVYDNLGLETAWKNYSTVLVSDGGGKMQPHERPAANWAFHSKRILDVIDNQVRSLRKRQLLDSYRSCQREGTYWGIGSNTHNERLPDALPAPDDLTVAIAATPTRLKKLPESHQQRIINWGYAASDAAIRSRVSERVADDSPPPRFPYAIGLG